MSEVTPLAFQLSVFTAFNTFWAGRTEICQCDRIDVTDIDDRALFEEALCHDPADA